jgi:pyrroline-5-carboxylate reductase
LLGASRLLTETGDTPEALRAMVTSPGGTTAAGLRVLESAGVRAAFLDAVSAATDRSKELGQT